MKNIFSTILVLAVLVGGFYFLSKLRDTDDVLEEAPFEQDEEEENNDLEGLLLPGQQDQPSNDQNMTQQTPNFDEVVHNKPEYDQLQHRRGLRFQGAFVYKPTPGLYKDIVVFDFLFF